MNAPNKRIRVNIDLPLEDAILADQMAARRCVSRSMLCRIALKVLYSTEQARERGEFVGSTPDRKALKQVFEEAV
jgi:hypothetical protein